MLITALVNLYEPLDIVAQFAAHCPLGSLGLRVAGAERFSDFDIFHTSGNFDLRAIQMRKKAKVHHR